jgi:DNA polymerase I-like protein with 3'-5' exonuclease and polymerase domains
VITLKSLTFDITTNIKGIRYNPELPVVENKGAKNRVLFIIDKMDVDEKNQDALLVGQQGKLLANLVNWARETYIEREEDRNFSWSCINFINGKLGRNSTEQYSYFVERIEAYAKKFKPTSVVCLSTRFLRYFYPEKFSNYQEYGKYLGSYVVHKKLKIFPCLDLLPLLFRVSEGGVSGALEIISNVIANGIAGRIQYGIDSERIKSAEIKMVDTLERFKILMKRLRKQSVIAIDTETTNLNKVKNQLLTIQFCYNLDEAYILPVFHKDSSFKREEIEYMLEDLRDFFEGDNNVKWFIYHNANFDLNVIRSNCGIRYYPNRLWDTIAGEFGLSENWKFINGAPGIDFKPYRLESLAVRRGFNEYGSSTIAKGDSKNIQNKSLSDPLVAAYMAYDVLVPFAVHQQQIREAKNLGYKRYVSLVSEQISDMIHCFSDMNMNGLPVDTDYLLYLNSKKSPIHNIIKEMVAEIYEVKEVKALNRKLVKEANIPSEGLFGAVKSWLFSLRTKEHTVRLFFEELGLKPLELGKPNPKTGVAVGKLNKKFKEKYADVPAVAAFNALEKAEKLRDGYVKSFLRKLKEDDDFKSDKCIRPNFNFSHVVTGRIAENEPNCQQIPSHSELGKHIKRLFTAPPGWLIIKVDYSAHEVRGLALISFDKILAGVFQVGLDLRKKFRRKPTPELAAEIELKGDVHKLNVVYFFGQDLTKIAKDALKAFRVQIKVVVFGLIYGKGNKSLSKDLDKPIDFVERLVKDFFKRFKSGGEWLVGIEKLAREFLFVESPLGRRRNLSSYLLPQTSESAGYLHAAMDRRARNSPIQGMCSDFGFIGVRRVITRAWERAKEVGRQVLKVLNVVHDSTEAMARYEHLMFGIRTIHTELTEGVEQTVLERQNFEFCIGLEIDLEVGSNLRDTQVWDGRAEELFRIIAEALIFQKLILGYKIEVKAILKHCLHDQFEDMPKYLQYQLTNGKEVDLDKIYKTALTKVKESKYI